MKLLCPKCSATMEPVEYEGITIFRCPNGDGHWVFGNSLAEIVKKEEEKIPEEYFDEIAKSGSRITDQRGVAPDIKCPMCGAYCTKVNYSYSSGIIIDHCPNGCGIWLDEGELEKVQAFYEYWNKNATKFLEQSGASSGLEETEPMKEKHNRRQGIFGLLESLYSGFLDN